MRLARHLSRIAALSCLLLGLTGVPARAQSYATLAAQPDPRDFVGRADNRLTLLGETMRFAGFDIGWLGVRPDGTGPAGPLSLYEIQDALATVQALGGTVVRVRPIAVVPKTAATPAHPSPDALVELDMVLKTARDLGLKVIVPLVNTSGDCTGSTAGPVCVYLRGRGLSQAGAFFTDRGVQADFLAGTALVLGRVNTLSGIVYRNDPTIMAWENCVACGAGPDAATAAVATWVEQLGQAIKSADPHHLYENGAFAGRIGPASAHPVDAAVFATPSVDIVGDDIATGSDPAVARTRLEATVAGVSAAARVYVLDSLPWTASVWKTGDDLATWLVNAARPRDLSGAVIGRLEAHAAAGGFLPPAPAAPARGVAALYFPGIKTADMEAAEMRARARALRRFAYTMSDITETPAYLLPPKPDIIGVMHGHVVWHGAAGAATYSVERSADPGAPGSWQLMCDACATDLSGGWQDPALPSAPAWYRVMPININGHKSVPSDPVQSKG